MKKILDLINWHFSFASDQLIGNTEQHFSSIFWLTIIFAIVSVIVTFFISHSILGDNFKAFKRTYDNEKLYDWGKISYIKLIFQMIVFYFITSIVLIFTGLFLGNIHPAFFIIGGLIFMVAFNKISMEFVNYYIRKKIVKKTSDIYSIICKENYLKIKNYENDLIKIL